MRSFGIATFALAVALVPAATFGLTAATRERPGGQQRAAGQPHVGEEPPAANEPQKLPVTTPAGILLVQIKPDQTAVFEEMMTRLKAGFAKTTDETLKKQAAGFRVYKSSEPFGPNTLYVVQIDPAVPTTDYDLFKMLQKTMTPEELRSPDTAEMWKKYVAAFAAGLSKLSLTPLQ